MKADELEGHLAINSYIYGSSFSQADIDEISAIAKMPKTKNTIRWFKHISFLINSGATPPSPSPPPSLHPSPALASPPAVKEGGDINDKVVSGVLICEEQDASRKEQRREEVNDALYAAVEADDLDKINEFAAKGAEVNFLSRKQLPDWKPNYAGTGKGYSPLHLACWKGSSRVIVDRLLELGADVHLKSADNYYVLHMASAFGHKDMVELLLDKGADIYNKDGLKWSALNRASFRGHANVCELLLDRNANIHDVTVGGDNSLHLASYYGYKCVGELLLSRGIRFHDKMITNSLTASGNAKIRGHKDFADMIDLWPVTMCILVLQDLTIYQYLDALSVYDLMQFIGSEADYLK